MTESEEPNPTLQYSSASAPIRPWRSYFIRVAIWEAIAIVHIVVGFLIEMPYRNIFRNSSTRLPDLIEYCLQTNDWMVHDFGWIVLLFLAALVPLPLLIVEFVAPPSVARVQRKIYNQTLLLGFLITFALICLAVFWPMFRYYVLKR